MVTLPWRDAALCTVGFLLGSGVSAVPALFAGADSAWFQALVKPAVYPPPFIFGVVPTALFTQLGIALWLVPRSDHEARAPALALFTIQMPFNVTWTPIFFTQRAIAAALGLLLGRLVLVGSTITTFHRVDRRAAALLVPYLL